MCFSCYAVKSRMFELVFGWPKARKCKKLIREVQRRLVPLKNKRYSVVRHLRQDVGELLLLGQEKTAFRKVEQIYKDESIIEVYELLDYFCDFLVNNMSYIGRRNDRGDCTSGIREAISSLVYASARCGDIPKLRKIRKLFEDRYGEGLVATALELLPGNLVNIQIQNNLSIKSVADDVKLDLVDEIFRDYCLQCEPAALEYNSEWHEQQEKKHCGGEMSDLKEAHQTLGAAETEKEAFVLYASDEAVRCPEKDEVYMDEDIEEIQHTMSKDINLLDQRLFVFKSSILPRR